MSGRGIDRVNMARGREKHANTSVLDPKDIENINMIGTRMKKQRGKYLWTSQGPPFDGA